MHKYKHFIVLAADILIVFVAFLFSLLVKDEFIVMPEHYADIARELPFVMIVYIVTFELLGMYKSLWKYASVEELLRGGFANFAAINIAYIILMISGLYNFNYSLYFIAFFIASTGTIGMRLSYRVYRFYVIYRSDTSHKLRTLIIGAGSAGVMLVDEIYQNSDFDKKIVGFIDDDKSKVGRSVRGVPVFGTLENLNDIAHENNIHTIIIAIPSLNFQETRKLLNQVEETGCQIKMMPPFYEMVGSHQDILKVRDIKIEDLLGREPITLDTTGIQEFIEDKTILVTGGGGSIGSELCRQLRPYNPEKIIIVDIYENNAYDLQMEFQRLYRHEDCTKKPEIIVLIANVREQYRIDQIFEEYKPNIVFHAAAHKHVPLMEVSPQEAIKNNVFGTYNVALMADKHKVEKMVLISTDKAVRPTNIMGASKRIAEKVIMAMNEKSETDFAAVRFGNVLGSNGSVIPLFKKQIEEGGPVTVTHPDIIRFFMTIPEACQLVIQAGTFAKGGELFVLDMGEQVKILDLAEKLIRLSGLEPHRDIPIIFTGLRPGEKMYEETLKNEVTTLRTDNELIFIERNNNGYKHILVEIQDLNCCNDEFNAIDFAKKNVSSYIDNK